ncbi:MAG: hypothetical protein KZQ66_09910 [Candidatus Thiodiazotropha sp. (ex Lucinoma aequizonata)]|nr:hypothetical protein [Candidatus Thiodiazotropha sp. (ex Lucinoma aequizonata)]MCU7887025.1 hypothetical protein [Candidatus Thiodiazotropha sp. (ex Lucinoma aequizonata)]MCU7893837.1 hypothetical protein [Candidatus Thiodiazotropha sp. (ex Lucinoma aequizonata)]MCU7897499.1 hypothetical protein [Candidatus Thiodiazotropha sp. (ex Lucinoma aequizonata)]MCU7902264.1 hypothetical protein [Candidatus Thiodiazotropha sp. (ex Lucinoma aequizonata)]
MEVYPEKGIKSVLQGDLLVNLEIDTLDIQNLSLESGKLNLAGRVQDEDIQTNPTFKGNLKSG